MEIKVKNLKKAFKNEEVLNIDEAIFSSNHIYGIFGRNGSGKSVFLKILCGFYIQSDGDVLIDGVDYNRKNDIPNNLGCLFDSNCFYDDISGRKNLELLAKINKKISNADIDKVLDIVSLDEPEKKFSKYSVGNKQKIGIAQAIMENPDIIILDEPFNGVDRQSVKKISDYLKHIKKDKVIIISSHIKEDLQELCDEYYFLENKDLKKVNDINDL